MQHRKQCDVIGEEELLAYDEEFLIEYEYEGGLEEYEDPADSFVLKGLKGRVIA